MNKTNSCQYLNVPYSEKDAAKQLGAKWDADARKWFVPPGIAAEAFSQWFIVERPSSAPVKKPQSQVSKLTIELVPSTCWYSNVRSEISTEEWDKLKKQSYRQASYRCEVCGGQGENHPVECHEIWHYDDDLRVQTLKGLISLCPTCHEVKHIGLAQINGRYEQAAAHLAKVNGWTEEQTDLYIERSFEIWQKRSQVQWQLDISYLEREGG
jgi:5-methylcytosine-specific restriction endonuclease McrA